MKPSDCERCRTWGNDGPCPDHGGDYRELGAVCPECGRYLALKPNGNFPPHKPSGRQSWRSGYGNSKMRPMVDRFEFNRCPGGGRNVAEKEEKAR